MSFSEIYLGTCLFIILYISFTYREGMCCCDCKHLLQRVRCHVPLTMFYNPCCKTLLLLVVLSVRSSYYASSPVLQLFKPDAVNFTLLTLSCWYWFVVTNYWFVHPTKNFEEYHCPLPCQGHFGSESKFLWLSLLLENVTVSKSMVNMQILWGMHIRATM